MLSDHWWTRLKAGSRSRRAAWVLAGLTTMLCACGRLSGQPAPRAADADVATSGGDALPVDADKARTSGPAAALPPARAGAPAAYRLVPAAGEFRGAWLHWQDYANPTAIARTIQRARRAHLNVLLPLANFPHQAMWQSRLLPVNPNVPAGFDPLRELAQAGHAAGVQIHPYLVMLHGGITKHPAIQPAWYARDAQGHTLNGWLNPVHPEVRQFLVGLVREVVATGVDGIHYDYIRHEYDSDYDYSEFTRARFNKEHGFDPLQLRGQPTGRGMRLLQTTWHANDGAGLLAQQKQFLANAGYRPPVVLDGNLPLLPTGNIVVAGNLYSGKVRGEVVQSLIAFVANGGAAVILDGPEVTTQSQRLTEAVGLSGKGYFDQRPVRFSVLAGPDGVTDGIDRQFTLSARGNPCPKLGDAKLLALFDDGTPAVVYKPFGKGHFVVFNWHCYQGASATSPAVLRLFGNLVEWLGRQHNITNTTRIQTSGGEPPSAATWDRWRIDQVSALVQALTAAAREVRPQIICSAAGGTQQSDLVRVKRDGLTWLRRNDVQFLCPMAYATDNGKFAQRLEAELAPTEPVELRKFLFAGIGVYKAPRATRRWLEQIQIARNKGFKGVCLFAFESLTDELIAALAAGPFQRPAPLPWTQVPVR